MLHESAGILEYRNSSLFIIFLQRMHCVVAPGVLDKAQMDRSFGRPFLFLGAIGGERRLDIARETACLPADAPTLLPTKRN